MYSDRIDQLAATPPHSQFPLNKNRGLNQPLQKPVLLLAIDARNALTVTNWSSTSLTPPYPRLHRLPQVTVQAQFVEPDRLLTQSHDLSDWPTQYRGSP